MSNIINLLAVCGAYGIGSIPSGYLVARLQGIQDIRQHGSGNIGATNVARILGLPYFFLIFFLDFFKAYVYLYLLAHGGFFPSVLTAAAVCILLGNVFPLFLGLRGGKGVATSAGIFLALNASLFYYSVLVWLFVFVITRVVGIASVVALALLPFISWILLHDAWFVICFTGVVSLFGIFLHRENVRKFLY